MLRTAFDVETRFGLRTFEVHQGDITGLDFPVDVLVVSAFPNDYTPVRRTVIGALDANRSISVEALSLRPALDLRSGLSCWLSAETGCAGIGRVLCVEQDLGEPEKALRYFLLALGVAEALPAKITTVAMPLLATGNQDLDPEAVVGPLLDGARDALHRLPGLERLCLVVLDEAKATWLAGEMETLLGRTPVRAQGQLVDLIRADLGNLLAKVDPADPVWAEVLPDLRQLLRGEATSITIGIHGRRFVERLARELLGRSKEPFELWKRIERVGERVVAPWITSYMHAIRTIGNESAHDKETGNRHPAHPANEDVAHCLYCVLRLVQFWSESGAALTGRKA